MKARNTSLYGSVISKIQHYRLDKLFIIFLLSLSVVACSDDPPNSDPKPETDQVEECRTDDARCQAR